MKTRAHTLALAAAFAAAFAGLGAATAEDPRLPRPRPAEAVSPPRAESPAPDLAAGITEAAPAAPYDRLAHQFEVAALVRLPRPRPAQPGEVSGPIPTVAAPEPALAAVRARLPRGRPKAAEAILAALTPTEPEPESFEDLPYAGPTFTDAEDASCQAKLRGLGAVFEETDPLDPGGACFVEKPLTVTHLGAGVAMQPAGTLNCPTALALAQWVQETVVPAAKRELGEAPSSITHASTYVCRSRYNAPGARVSEHAFAAAVDIAAIRFGTRDPYEVKRQTSASERRFQAAIRGAACEHFTTVLGPGSNAAHETHLHFDTAQRRGGYRLCDLDPPPFVAEAPAAPSSGKDEPNTSRE